MKIDRLIGINLIKPADKMKVVHNICGVQVQFKVNAMRSLKMFLQILRNKKLQSGTDMKVIIGAGRTTYAVWTITQEIEIDFSSNSKSIIVEGFFRVSV